MYLNQRLLPYQSNTLYHWVTLLYGGPAQNRTVIGRLQIYSPTVSGLDQTGRDNIIFLASLKFYQKICCTRPKFIFNLYLSNFPKRLVSFITRNFFSIMEVSWIFRKMVSEKFLNAHLACHSDNVFLLRGLEPCNNVIYRYHIEYQVITRSYILFFERREE